MMITTLFAAALLASGESSDPPIRFVDEAAQRGVDDPAINATGPAFADFDNDGDVDVYVPGEALAEGLDNRLWRNDGRGHFTNVAPELGIDNVGGYARGAAWGDYDNDGDVDLVVANMPPGTSRREHVPTTLYKSLLVEKGKPGFENVTRAAGLMRAGNKTDAKIGGIGNTGAGVSWGDYDSDGDLDLFWKCAEFDVDNALFRNEGDGTFVDVTKEAGVGILDKVTEANSQGSPNWTDIDNDGALDLLVTNEGDANVLFRNAGDATFIDITKSRKPPSGFSFVNPGNAQGACVGDFDNDGDMDFYLPHADQANRLIASRLTESGSVAFDDVTLASGTGDVGGARGCVTADFDNDGLLDLYVNNGGPSNVLINDVIAQMPAFVQFYIAWEPANNVLYRNLGDLKFTDVTAGSGAEVYGIGSGVGAADVNDDGYLDLFVTHRTYYSNGRRVNVPQSNALLMNHSGANNWIKIRLKGSAANRDGYGAWVTLTAGDLVQHREHTSAHGYNSTNDPRLSFGLAAHGKVDSIHVRWPGGGEQTLTDVAINQTLEIAQSTKP